MRIYVPWIFPFCLVSIGVCLVDGAPNGLNRGSPCDINGLTGTCKRASECNEGTENTVQNLPKSHSCPENLHTPEIKYVCCTSVTSGEAASPKTLRHDSESNDVFNFSMETSSVSSDRIITPKKSDSKTLRNYDEILEVSTFLPARSTEQVKAEVSAGENTQENRDLNDFESRETLRHTTASDASPRSEGMGLQSIHENPDSRVVKSQKPSGLKSRIEFLRELNTAGENSSLISLRSRSESRENFTPNQPNVDSDHEGRMAGENAGENSNVKSFRSRQETSTRYQSRIEPLQKEDTVRENNMVENTDSRLVESQEPSGQEKSRIESLQEVNPAGENSDLISLRSRTGSRETSIPHQPNVESVHERSIAGRIAGENSNVKSFRNHEETSTRYQSRIETLQKEDNARGNNMVENTDFKSFTSRSDPGTRRPGFSPVKSEGTFPGSVDEHPNQESSSNYLEDWRTSRPPHTDIPLVRTENNAGRTTEKIFDLASLQSQSESGGSSRTSGEAFRTSGEASRTPESDVTRSTTENYAGQSVEKNPESRSFRNHFESRETFQPRIEPVRTINSARADNFHGNEDSKFVRHHHESRESGRTLQPSFSHGVFTERMEENPNQKRSTNFPEPPRTPGRPEPNGASRTESVARQKCREYSQMAFKNETSPALIVGPDVQVDTCVRSGDGLIVGGNRATLGEFPHMALLGYGEDSSNLIYQCGGSLISEDYVLTAAHCSQREVPKFVLLGDLILRNESDGAHPELIPVEKITVHPKYNALSHYFDVALVRLRRRPKLGPYLRPACLHTGTPISSDSFIATGWGATQYGGDPSDILMKVSLNEIPLRDCNGAYRSTGAKLASGILNEQQICAGSLEGGRDTCQGDSGGPLQVFHFDPHCTYDIVGVTSFGQGCGARNSPGVYARVQFFVKWIEDTVWPRGDSRRRATDTPVNENVLL